MKNLFDEVAKNDLFALGGDIVLDAVSFLQIPRLSPSQSVSKTAPAPVASNPPINGTENDDVLNGTAGDDIINGLGGNDIINGSAGADEIDGGAGTDIVDYSASAAGFTFNFRNGSNAAGVGGDAEGDTVRGIDGFIGSAFDDRIDYGNGFIPNVSFDAGEGNDVLALGEFRGQLNSALTFLGGNGNDDLRLNRNIDNNNRTAFDQSIMDGGAGIDTLRINGSGSVDFSTTTLTGFEVLDFAGNVENYVVTFTAEQFSSFTNVDTSRRGTLEINVLMEDATTLDLSGLSTGGGNASPQDFFITGDADSEQITGSSRGDVINGDGGDDTLNGGRGADLINGGEGNDTLVIADVSEIVVGAETYNGGDGTDTLDLLSAGTHDLRGAVQSIEAFSLGVDGTVLQLSSDQFGFSDDVDVSGSAGAQTIEFDLSGDEQLRIDEFTFTDWTFEDSVTFTGDGGDNEVRIGDALSATFTGGAGDDEFVIVDVITDLDQIAFEGGDGFDALRLDVRSSATSVSDLREATLSSIEQLGIFTGFSDNPGAVATVQITGEQVLNVFAADLFVELDFNDDEDSVVFIDMQAVTAIDLSAWTFRNADFDTSFVEIGGTVSNDVITGSSIRDVIRAGDGNDRLDGSAGNDLLEGGDGNDVFIAGAGADHHSGGNGTDRVDYTADTTGLVIDMVNGANGTGLAAGDTFARIQRIDAGSGNDTIEGNAAGTRLFGHDGDDILNGNDGADRLFGGSGADTLNGGNQRDVLRGGDDNDLLDGGDANDQLFGDDGDDELIGGAGNDVLVGGAGADILNGGAGIDRVTYTQSSSGITVDVLDSTLGTGEAAGDSLIDIELIQGSQFDDIISGNGTDERLIGQDGDDTLNGRGGDDRLDGGAGRDQLNGDEGNDTLIGGDGGDILSGGIGDDLLRGGSGDDILAGGDGRDVLIGGAGGDSFDGGLGNDRVSYSDASSGIILNLLDTSANMGDAAGDTFASIEVIDGSNFADTLSGSAGGDRLRGENGADTLIGRGGNDRLEGGRGSDSLNGGFGDDRLEGGIGADTYTGGNGADLFEFTGLGGNDVVTDFNKTDGDRLFFNAADGVTSFSDLSLHTIDGTDTLITYAGGTVLLENIISTDLSAADFSIIAAVMECAPTASARTMRDTDLSETLLESDHEQTAWADADMF
ncbi:MAG: hypothetical protein AAGF20_06055 [Pseudomonadota bacterium]